jgi:SrtB family sortase
MEKKNNSVVKKVIVAVLVVVLLVAAVFMTKFFIDKSKEPSNGDIESPISSTIEQTTEPIIKPDYSEYVEQNADTVGWITIPGTQINFPVVQCDNNDYYLTHTFDHKKDKRGAIYMDCRNNPLNLDANTIIYGHNDYQDGSVFSEVAHYDDVEYFKEHPIIEFNTLDSYYQWKIYAVFITNQQAYDDNGYIFNFIWPQMEGPNFKGYVEELNKRTLYYTGVDIKNGDRMLTLSSCARNLDTAGTRAKTSIVVVARAVRPGEDPTVDVSKAYVNENPKYPQRYYDIKGIVNPYKNDKKWYPVVID